MAGPQVFPDTVFDISLFNEWQQGVGVPTYTSAIPTAGATGGRLMSSMPHVDGLCVCAPNGLNTSSSGTAGALTRVGKDQWAIVASVAANTNYYAANISESGYRTGETYIFAVNEPSSGSKLAPLCPPKGIAITSIFAGYVVGTLALTTATLRLGKAVYTNGVAPAQTDILAATAVATAISTNFTLAVVAVPGNPDTQPFLSVGDSSIYNTWTVELNTVQQATSTLSVYFVGFGFNFNWN